jgi:hypothetical protein
MASKRKAWFGLVRVPFVGPFMYAYGHFDSDGRHIEPQIVLPSGEAPTWSDSSFYRNEALHFFTAPIKSLRPFLDAMKKRRPVPQNYDAVYGHHFVNERGEVVRLIVSSHSGDLKREVYECIVRCEDPRVAATFVDWVLENVPGTFVDRFYRWPGSIPPIDPELDEQNDSAGRPLRRFALLHGLSAMKVMETLGSSNGWVNSVSRGVPKGIWALRVFMFFSPKQGTLDHIVDSQIYWPKNNVQPLVMFTTVGETRRDNIEWGNSATRERAANRPATWGVFSQAPNRKLAAEFVEWFDQRLGTGQSSGRSKRRA